VIFFTSDTHFGHYNIIKYCKRPWHSVAEMDEALINNWNNTVKLKDEVWHLGDFRMGRGDPRDYLSRLNGRIHLICGNHDRCVNNSLGGFYSIQNYKELKLFKKKIILMHYPMRTWNKSHRGSWHLFGHVHGTMTKQYGRKALDDCLAMDVGVDCHNYKPISIHKVVEIMRSHTDYLKEKFRSELDSGKLSNKERQFRERMLGEL